MERGKARYALVAEGSNTTVKRTAGSLYGLLVAPANGASVRVEDATDLGATPDLNATGASTIARIGTYAAATPDEVGFGPGVGFSALTIAATSNARVTVVYE